jgi:hypothetical protein
MIAWMAWLLQHSIGTSLYALRLLPFAIVAICAFISIDSVELLPSRIRGNLARTDVESRRNMEA